MKRLQDAEVRRQTGGRHGVSDLLRPSHELYDQRYWDLHKGSRRLLPEQERFLNSTRFKKMTSKFDPETHNHKRPSSKELHCSECSVWVPNRAQMQAHMEGAKHKRRTGTVQEFACSLCHVTVPCQNTLDSHMKGKDHLKRVKTLEERRKQEAGMEEGGHRVGPLQMVREELDQLRWDNRVLTDSLRRSWEEIENLKWQARDHVKEDSREDNDIKVLKIKRQARDVKKYGGEYFENEFEDDVKEEPREYVKDDGKEESRENVKEEYMEESKDDVKEESK